MKKILVLISMLYFSSLLNGEASYINVDMGIKSYVGGFFYRDNDNKDFEYKSNHNWYLAFNKVFNEKIRTEAEIRYYPELFDKKLYLYSAKVEYISGKHLDVSWEYDRIGLGSENIIYRNKLNNIRSDQNFITDYRFNGPKLIHKFNNNIIFNYRIGGNEHNTGIAAFELELNKAGFSSEQSFLFISRDNKFNAKALNINNYSRWRNSTFLWQNMLHLSIIDYYRKAADTKSRIFKNLTELEITIAGFIQPQLGFYYEVENWTDYRIYELNSILNLSLQEFTLSPGFRYSNYNKEIERELSFLINYKLHLQWDIAFNTEYKFSKNNQDIISYGLQTKFNFPLSSYNIRSIVN